MDSAQDIRCYCPEGLERPCPKCRSSSDIPEAAEDERATALCPLDARLAHARFQGGGLEAEALGRASLAPDTPANLLDRLALRLRELAHEGHTPGAGYPRGAPAAAAL